MPKFNLFKKAAPQATAQDSITKAIERRKAALSVFSKASEQLSQANGELALLIAQHREQQARTAEIIQNAEIAMSENNKLKVRLDAFTPNEV
jgi:ABC-type transporter Mla subunit MlaD